MAPLRTILLVLSTAYLVYLAFRIATSGARVAIDAAEKPLRFMNGIAMQIINPKAYAVMTTLFSGFAFMPGNTALEALIKAVVFTSISMPPARKSCASPKGPTHAEMAFGPRARSIRCSAQSI